MAFGPVRKLFVVLDPAPAISSTLLSIAVGFKDWILFIIGPLLGTVTVSLVKVSFLDSWLPTLSSGAEV